MIKIMFVCHGNICRSTMAEFVLKDMVKKQNIEDNFFINSSATSRDAIGSDIHYGTKNILTQNNIPFTKRKAVQFTAKDYDIYDYIICMDTENVKNTIKIIGKDINNKISKLLDFTDDARDVKDPWYTNNFQETYNDVLNGCKGILDKIQLL